MALTMQRVKLALISEGINTWPIYAAQAQGFFSKRGLDVDLTVTGSSVHQLKEMVSGGFDIGVQQSDHVVRAVEKGSDLFIAMAQSHAPDLTVVVAPDITSFAQLKGRTLAVDGARTGYALLLRQLLASNGITDPDVTFVEIGGSQERFDAVKGGATQLVLLNPPFDRKLLESGFGSLGAINDFFPAYPGPIAAARRSWAKVHGEQMVAYIAACREAYRWLQNPANREAAKTSLPARLGIESAQADRALDRMEKQSLPAVSDEGIRQVIDVVWSAEGFPGTKPGPERYTDFSFLDRARAQD
jgi:ABC-type nitrate/sulfonate/bicarbonate transport system substrate-binding protein